MTEELFPTKVVYAPVPPIDIWVVCAYWSVGGWWKVDQFKDELEADEYAKNLGRGYGERRIYHLK